MKKRLQATPVDHQNLPSGLVEWLPGIVELSSGARVGVQSLYREVIKSGVDVWQPTSNMGRKMFVTKPEVVDAVQLWLNSSERDDGGLIGYASMPLSEYIRKMLDEEKTEQGDPLLHRCRAT